MANILVADDEVVQCLQLQERLTSMGHEVAMAHSGEETVSLTMLIKPDLILMDIVMPGCINGIDAAKIILSQIHIPIVFITGCEDKNRVNEASLCSPASYLYKPVSEAQLYAVINIALNMKPLRESTPHPINFFSATSIKKNDDHEKSSPLTRQNLLGSFLLREMDAEDVNSLMHEDINIHDSFSNELILPMIRKISGDKIRLSPAEIQVAILVRMGKSSKQIAEILKIAAETANSHRKNIRKKLGITSSNINLGTYLCSL